MKSLVVAVSAFSLALGALAQETSGGAGQLEALQTSEPTPQAGQIFRPQSSRPQPGGVHTTYVLRSNDGSKPLVVQSPAAMNPTAQGLISPLANVELAETPQSLGCLYVGEPRQRRMHSQLYFRFRWPNRCRLRRDRAGRRLDNPNAASDLAAFDCYWGLPPATRS